MATLDPHYSPHAIEARSSLSCAAATVGDALEDVLGRFAKMQRREGVVDMVPAGLALPAELLASYGADALRFGAAVGGSLADGAEAGHRLCQELWELARQRQSLGSDREEDINPLLLTLEDKWILLRLNAAVDAVTAALAEHRFAEITEALKRIIHDCGAWYLPACRTAGVSANGLAVTDFVLGHSLRLLYPLLPFVTEELWLGLGYNADLPDNQGGLSLATARWPTRLDEDELAYFGILPEDEAAAWERFQAAPPSSAIRGD
jgi:valyl-tRNA synthetase